MKLQNIDKLQYRHRLNRIIIGFIISFALLSLGFGTLLIELFGYTGEQVVENMAEKPSNFKFNLAGVVIALVICGAILHRLRENEYFNEVYYVWQVKQLQNLIYRKLNKIKSAATEKSDVEAIKVLNFYYESLKQVYQLDDNTLTMSTVDAEHQQIITLAEKHQIRLDNAEFDKQVLNNY